MKKEKIIRVRNCGNCFYVRNLANMENIYCCIKKIMIDTYPAADYKIKNIKTIPKWCPLEDYKK